MGGLNIAWLNQLDIFHPWAGGAERHCVEVSKRLVRRGHQVTVFSERYGDLPASDTIEGIHIERPAGRVGLHLWARTSLRGFLPQPFDVIIQDLSKVLPWQLHNGSPVPSIAIVRHVNGRLLMREAPLPTGPAFWAAERFYRFAYRDTPVVTEARSTQRTLVELGLPPESIHIVRPGVDHHLFFPNTATKAPRPEILFVGRLKGYKGADLAIEALAELVRTLPAAHLTIAGRGPERERLERLVDRLGVAPSVTFAGFVSAEELAELYRRAWVHVQPSVVEGWGLTAIEAAACGTPTVAFRGGALPESVGPVSEPFLTDDRTGVALAASLRNCIEQLASEPTRLSSALCEYARDFDWDRTASGYEQLLLGVASSLGQPHPTIVGSPLPMFSH